VNASGLIFVLSATPVVFPENVIVFGVVTGDLLVILNALVFVLVPTVSDNVLAPPHVLDVYAENPI
jgi:hypothetical protein